MTLVIYMVLGAEMVACVRLSLFFLCSTHHQSAVHQIIKLQYNVIKIQGAIKGLKWAEGDLEDLDY